MASPLNVHVFIIDAVDLIAGDRDGSTAPYVILKYGDKKSKRPQTKYLRKSWQSREHATWNESFAFRYDPNYKFIKFSLMDKDQFKRDDKLGCCILTLVCIENKWQEFILRVKKAESGLLHVMVKFSTCLKEAPPTPAQVLAKGTPIIEKVTQELSRSKSKSTAASTEFAISAPQSCSRVMHLGFSNEGTFEAEGLSEEWKAWLRGVGVKRKHMANPEKRRAIFEVIFKAMVSSDPALQPPVNVSSATPSATATPATTPTPSLTPTPSTHTPTATTVASPEPPPTPARPTQPQQNQSTHAEQPMPPVLPARSEPQVSPPALPPRNLDSRPPTTATATPTATPTPAATQTTQAPPPPPPPPMHPPATSGGAPPPPPPPPARASMIESTSGGGGGGDLAQQIQAAKLKSASERPPPPPRDSPEGAELVRRIMSVIRPAVGDSSSEDDDGAWDD
ncbi:hypothetical protein Pelo_1646 [Pelomyxa schiedti]|nr:hypothetical protein Pelo_1646 [Pelomyxa schiedti]